MKFALAVLTLILSGTRGEYEYTIEVKTLTLEQSKALVTGTAGAGTKLAQQIGRGAPSDNGGNYGDLTYRYRENRDRLLVREVVINEELASVQQDINWSVSISGARVSSVRVLNFGRERAYCLRIDVAGGDVQVILRIPPLYDPRVMIEIYGF